jgi:hypothetical protein
MHKLLRVKDQAIQRIKYVHGFQVKTASLLAIINFGDRPNLIHTAYPDFFAQYLNGLNL